MELKIEKGVPIPLNAGGKGGGKYPLNTMEVGDSFFVPGECKHALSRAALLAKRRGIGTFTVRKEGEGYRMWRIA